MNMKNLLLYSFFLLIFQFAKAQEQFILYFDSNKFELNKTENDKFQSWISSNKDSKIVAINGYTDEDGSNSFNDTLAKRRVEFALSEVKSKIKIREDFKSRSYGEDFKQAVNKAENRKVTIYYILPKDLLREDEILGIKKDVVVKPRPVPNYPEKLVFTNPNGTKSEFKLDVEFMKEIDKGKAGEKLKIENLNFVINTFIVVNESRGKMYELLLVMEQNPKLKIEIQGNLCCQPIDRTNLSTQRAKAMYNFLVNNKIDKSRLSYKGFGSSRPIYPLPEKNEEERAANRRVEILILENE
jgi:outer membrane protein OmpA-like peptidoglycan-associated protein